MPFQRQQREIVMLFDKSDMSLTHYSWRTGPKDSRFEGEPDGSEFVPEEGNEVLYVINKALQTLGASEKTKLHKGESLIKEELPTSLREQRGVHDWLVDRLREDEPLH